VDHGDRVAGEQGVGAAGDAAVVADVSGGVGGERDRQIGGGYARPITGLTLSQAFGAFVSVSDIDWVSDGFALAGCIRGGSGADRVPGRPGRRRPGHGPLVGGRPTAPKIARLPGG